MTIVAEVMVTTTDGRLSGTIPELRTGKGRAQHIRPDIAFKIRPLSASKDKTDVIKLIQARRFPRDLNVADPVRQHYLETWDALQAER